MTQDKRSLDYYYKALKLYESEGNIRYMADDNITIEAIKKYLKNNPQEIDEFKRIINDEQNLIKEKKNDNITLLIKFEQSGKTKIILDNIKKNKKQIVVVKSQL